MISLRSKSDHAALLSTFHSSYLPPDKVRIPEASHPGPSDLGPHVCWSPLRSAQPHSLSIPPSTPLPFLLPRLQAGYVLSLVSSAVSISLVNANFSLQQVCRPLPPGSLHSLQPLSPRPCSSAPCISITAVLLAVLSVRFLIHPCCWTQTLSGKDQD